MYERQESRMNLDRALKLLKDKTSSVLDEVRQRKTYKTRAQRKKHKQKQNDRYRKFARSSQK